MFRKDLVEHLNQIKLCINSLCDEYASPSTGEFFKGFYIAEINTRIDIIMDSIKEE